MAKGQDNIQRQQSRLNKTIFGELLRMPQEEFGLTCDGRITLPFDAVVMEYAMCLLRTNASEEVERPFLSSIVMPCQIQV